MKTIPLTQGQVAIVDDADFEWLMQWKWHALKGVRKFRTTFYAQRHEPKNNRKIIGMHCQILQPKPGLDVDHIDGNGLNNSRSNLREASRTQNNGNRQKAPACTSRYKGVSWHKRLSKWQAKIWGKERRVHLGYFHDQESAAAAYDLAAEKYFGEFALTNKAMQIS